MIAALLSASSGSASRRSLGNLHSFANASFSGYQALPDTGELRQEFHQNYPFSATGRVSVENLNGEVRINV